MKKNTEDEEQKEYTEEQSDWIDFVFYGLLLIIVYFFGNDIFGYFADKTMIHN